MVLTGEPPSRRRSSRHKRTLDAGGSTPPSVHVRCSVLTERRTLARLGRVDTGALVADALEQLGIDARRLVHVSGNRVDLVLDPNGVGSLIQVKYRSLVTHDVAVRLLAEPLTSNAALLVVADRVTEEARKALTAGGGGYLDLRGRLALHTGHVVIDAEVEPVRRRPERTEALSGKAGLEVATALLMQPEGDPAVRVLARELGRSPSTVSTVLSALRRSGSIDGGNVVAGPELFWQVAERWSRPRVLLAQLPAPGDAVLTKALRLGLDDVEHESGWALTDSAAAVAYGAPIAISSNQTLDFFVSDLSVIRRATTLLGAAVTASRARASVRVAPVPAVVQRRIDLNARAGEWPLAHPLFVALDLAQDVGRGREILKAWTPDDRWIRVW